MAKELKAERDAALRRADELAVSEARLRECLEVFASYDMWEFVEGFINGADCPDGHHNAFIWLGAGDATDPKDVARNALDLKTPSNSTAIIEAMRIDATRYRFLRDEDNWGEDGEWPDSWEGLGEAHGADFDEYVDRKLRTLEVKP